MAYDDPAGLIAGSAVLEVLSLLCVALRFYSRAWRNQNIIASDWLILAAFIFGTGLVVMEIFGVAKMALAYPIGFTLDDPKSVVERVNIAKQLELSFLLLGIVAAGLVKLSAAFFYWHLFAKVSGIRRVLIVWIILLIIWTTSFVIAGLLECGTHLMAIFGQPQDYLDYCGAAETIGYGMVGSDVATDLITLAIPIPVVLSLQMNSKTKVLTLLTFMIGALSVGASIAKCYIYITAAKGVTSEDALLLLSGISIWNLVEIHIGIIAASGPTLRPILTHLLPTESLLSLVSLLRFSAPQTSTLPGGSLGMPQDMSNSAEYLKLPKTSTSGKSATEVGATEYETATRGHSRG